MNQEAGTLRPDTLRLRDTSSPSPSRRRRSGSGIIREAHRIEDEEPYPTPFHNAEVQNALSSVKNYVSRMGKVLSSSHLHLEVGSAVQNLHQQALGLEKQQLPSSRIVGLIGDSGVGKSSLINSLLDRVDLVRAVSACLERMGTMATDFIKQSGSGTACTCAVTEYVYHDRDEFTVQVDYFSSDELKIQFEELLRAYRDYDELPGNSRARNTSDEEPNANKALEKKAELAAQTFRAIFTETQATSRVLHTMDFSTAIGSMVNWASQLLPVSGEEESYQTVGECASRLRELTSELSESPVRGGSPRRWPLIRKLRVHLNAYILSKGLIIADLPGLRDHNSARKAITERYLRQCHHIFAVARIDRAITDESVKEIFELARRANLTKVDVVCTRSEDVQIREAKHDWIADKVKLEELQRAIEEDRSEVEYIREQIEDFEQDYEHLNHEERREFEQLQQDYRKAERSKQSHEFEMLRFIVELRNAKVSGRLRAQYQDHPFASTLEIFCVSNKTYWDHRERPVTTSGPYIEMSGIKQLRQYCIGIVADSRLRAAVSFIKDQVPAFLASVGLWIEAGSGSSSSEKRQQILDLVSAVEEALEDVSGSH